MMYKPNYFYQMGLKTRNYIRNVYKGICVKRKIDNVVYYKLPLQLKLIGSKHFNIFQLILQNRFLKLEPNPYSGNRNPPLLEVMQIFFSSSID